MGPRLRRDRDIVRFAKRLMSTFLMSTLMLTPVLTSTSLILAAVHRIRIPEIVILLIAIALPAIAQNAISQKQKKMDKPAVDALYQQGVRSLQKGDLAAARAAFEKVVRLAPNAPE